MSQDSTLEERYLILKDVFGDVVYNRSKDEVLVFCPKHSHRMRKLSINVRKNAFRCWVCGYSGTKIFFLLRENANKQQKQRYLNTLNVKFDIIEEAKYVELPDEYRFASDFSTPTGWMMEKFIYDDMELESRVVLQTKLGFCERGPYWGRAIFPSFNKEGELNYFITRRIDGGDYKKYLDCPSSKYSIIFNEIFVNWTKPIILVESIKTHLRHFRIPNVVPILGTDLPEDHKLFREIVINKCPKVFVALDEDAKQKSMKIIEKLLSYGVDVRFSTFDVQPDEMTTSNFVDRLLDAKKFDKDKIIRERLLNL